MRYNDPSQQPGTGSITGDTSDPKAATTAEFGEFWGELAGRFKDNPKVIFGLMNGPYDMPTSLAIQDNQAAIDAIRKAGAKQLILAPGNSYTGGHAWLQSSQGNDPSRDYLYKIEDPEDNTAIDIHEYLDVDFSGSHRTCNQNASYNLDPLTEWLKMHKLKVWKRRITTNMLILAIFARRQ
jgi:endoglucanase